MKPVPFQNEAVKAYFEALEPGVRVPLLQVRAAVLEVLPQAEEVIKYGIPTYVVKKNVVHLAGWKNHLGFYPGPRCLDAFRDALKSFPQSKGTVQFRLDQELPLELIQAMTLYNMNRILGFTN